MVQKRHFKGGAGAQGGAGIPACPGSADRNVCATLFCTTFEEVQQERADGESGFGMNNQPHIKVGQAFLPARKAPTGMSAPPSFVSPSSATPIAVTERRLPHWHMNGAIYWVCFRLADSIPQDKLEAWKDERAAWIKFNPEPWDERQRKEYDQRFGDRMEAWLDAGMGSRALARADVREAVAGCLLRFDGDRLLIHAAVIMPTHVHALIEPLPAKKDQGGAGAQGGAGIPACPGSADRNVCATLPCATLPCHDLSRLLHGMKGASARLANTILGTTGNAFWMDESYDHIVRSESQYRHFLRYVQENPVKASLRDSEYWMRLPEDKVGQAFLPAREAQTGMSAPPSSTPPSKKSSKSVLTENPDLT